MIAQERILEFILKLSRNEPVSLVRLSKATKSPISSIRNILTTLCEESLISLKNEVIEISSSQRVKIALHLMKSGADPERISCILEWLEFEDLSAKIFELNSFEVTKNVRFRWSGRRWEIDLVACKNPIIMCIDCKHWSRGWAKSSIKKAAQAQALRSQSLAEALPLIKTRVRVSSWKKATFIPVILALLPSSIKLYRKVPIVPILQLQSFLNEFLGNMKLLRRYHLDLEIGKLETFFRE